MDLNGNIIYEESYEYRGSVALCKGGALRARRESEEQAKKSYQLQQEQLRFQKEQTEKLEQGKKSEEALKAARLQRGLELNKEGRGSTIMSIAKRPSFADFRAQYESENPLTEGMPIEEYNKIMKEKFEKTLPFKRLIQGEPILKKAALYA